MIRHEVLKGSVGYQQLDRDLTSASVQRVLLVSGGKSFVNCGGAEWLRPWTRNKTLLHVSISGSLLTSAAIDRWLPSVREFVPDLVLAVGGGTVLDLSKCLRAAYLLQADSAEALRHLSPKDPLHATPKLLHVAVPTTAGSGAESTPFAAVYSALDKFSIEHSALRPHVVFLEPSLLASLPQRHAVASALDAFAQAIESWWSNRSTVTSRAFAYRALSLIRSHLEPALCEGKPEAFAQLQIAANYSGRAIAHSYTTLCHALSYPLTLRAGIEHGIAVFSTLPAILRWNAKVCENDCSDPRGVAFVRERLKELCRLFQAPDIESLSLRWTNLFRTLTGVSSLSSLGVGTALSLQDLVESALASNRSGNNPRRISESSLRDLLADT